MRKYKDLLGNFLKNKFPMVEFIWDEDSGGWYSFDINFVSKYSRNFIGFHEKLHDNLKNKFRKETFRDYNYELIILDDFNFVGFTID